MILNIDFNTYIYIDIPFIYFNFIRLSQNTKFKAKLEKYLFDNHCEKNNWTNI